MNDDASARVAYRGRELQLETLFSDFVIRGESANDEIEDLAAELLALPGRWWDPYL
jgi:hypothetical protein